MLSRGTENEIGAAKEAKGLRKRRFGHRRSDASDPISHVPAVCRMKLRSQPMLQVPSRYNVAAGLHRLAFAE